MVSSMCFANTTKKIRNQFNICERRWGQTFDSNNNRIFLKTSCFYFCAIYSSLTMSHFFLFSVCHGVLFCFQWKGNDTSSFYNHGIINTLLLFTLHTKSTAHSDQLSFPTTTKAPAMENDFFLKPNKCIITLFSIYNNIFLVYFGLPLFSSWQKKSLP